MAASALPREVVAQEVVVAENQAVLGVEEELPVHPTAEHLTVTPAQTNREARSVWEKKIILN